MTSSHHVTSTIFVHYEHLTRGEPTLNGRVIGTHSNRIEDTSEQMGSVRRKVNVAFCNSSKRWSWLKLIISAWSVHCTIFYRKTLPELSHPCHVWMPCLGIPVVSMEQQGKPSEALACMLDPSHDTTPEEVHHVVGKIKDHPHLHPQMPFILIISREFQLISFFDRGEEVFASLWDQICNNFIIAGSLFRLSPVSGSGM